MLWVSLREGFLMRRLTALHVSADCHQSYFEFEFHQTVWTIFEFESMIDLLTVWGEWRKGQIYCWQQSNKTNVSWNESISKTKFADCRCFCWCNWTKEFAAQRRFTNSPSVCSASFYLKRRIKLLRISDSTFHGLRMFEVRSMVLSLPFYLQGTTHRRLIPLFPAF
jgi:hypothetical protein